MDWCFLNSIANKRWHLLKLFLERLICDLFLLRFFDLVPNIINSWRYAALSETIRQQKLK